MARIPPLNWLRAFEAAARSSSVSKGARELHVTPSAVSQHIRRLEEALGRKLLWRDGNRVRLSEDGQRLARELHAAFALISRAVEPFSEHGHRRHLVLRSPSAFLEGWLASRMERFRLLHPTIDVQCQATERSRRIDDEAADCEIIYGPDSLGEGGAMLLLRDSVVPVRAPGYPAKAVGSAHSQETQLLCGPPPPYDSWHHWLEQSGGGGFAGRIVEMPRVESAIEAAVYGVGVALLPASIADSRLAAGSLVLANEARLPSRNAYWILKHAPASTPGLDVLVSWLCSEAGMFNEKWRAK